MIDFVAFATIDKKIEFVHASIEIDNFDLINWYKLIVVVVVIDWYIIIDLFELIDYIENVDIIVVIDSLLTICVQYYEFHVDIFFFNIFVINVKIVIINCFFLN